MAVSGIPIIDISCLRDTTHNHASVQNLASTLKEACTQNGFFYVTGHGIPQTLIAELETHSRTFFARDEEEKMSIAMEKGGKAWRGYFPVGKELTSGIPDSKEGIYFGSELGKNDPRVKAGLPLHGANFFPHQPSEMKETVLRYMEAVTETGHLIMKGLALSLGLDGDHFHQSLTADPLILFRIFHYPSSAQDATQWGVGEHTDYGLLTILLQDSVGGLQVKSDGKWIDAPPIAGTFVCNIGDMLDRMTGGLYRSTPHRVKNTSGKGRLSFPLFFDPGFDAEVKRLEGIPIAGDDRNDRWDKASVHDFEGTYGDYLLRKVRGAFPQLGQDVL